MRKTFINPRPFNDHRLYQSLLGISGAVAITLLPAGQVFAGNSPLEDDDVVSRQRTISHQPNLDTIPPDLIRLIFSYSHPPYSIVDVNVSKAIRTAILGKWNHVYMMPEKLIKQAFLPKKSRTLFKASIIMPDLKTVIFDHRANDTLDFVETLTLWDFEASPHSFKNLFGSLARNMCLSHLIFDGQTLFLDGWNQFKEWSDQPRHQNLKSFSVKAGLCNLQTKNQISVKPLLLGLSNQSQLATLKMDNINLMNTCLTEETLTAFSKLINVSDLSLSGSLCGLSSSSLQKLGKILGQMPLQKIDISRNCFAEGELENLLSPMLQNPAPKTQLEEFNASNLYQLFRMMSEKDAHFLSQLLPKLNPAYVNLSHNGTNSSVLAQLLNALKQCNRIHALDLSKNDIKGDIIDQFEGIFHFLPTLKTLDLSKNTLTDTGFKNLIERLKKGPTTQTLDAKSILLRDCHVNIGLGYDIFTDLNAIPSITSLDLSYNTVLRGDFGSSLGKNTTLKSLKLSNIKRPAILTTFLTPAWVEGIFANRHLTDLDLSHNQISNIAGMISILSSNTVLKHINLSGNFPHTFGQSEQLKAEIGTVLSKNNTLKTIKLNRISFDRRAMNCLLAGLCNNNSLKKVFLDETSVGDHALLEILVQNPLPMKFLSLRGNKIPAATMKKLLLSKHPDLRLDMN